MPGLASLIPSAKEKATAVGSDNGEPIIVGTSCHRPQYPPRNARYGADRYHRYCQRPTCHGHRGRVGRPAFVQDTLVAGCPQVETEQRHRDLAPPWDREANPEVLILPAEALDAKELLVCNDISEPTTGLIHVVVDLGNMRLGGTRELILTYLG